MEKEEEGEELRKKKLDELREHLKRKPDLVINRVPRKELAWFKEWSKEEYEDDYGFSFKALCTGFMPPENTQLLMEIDELKKRVLVLEKMKKEEQEPEVRRSINGQPIGLVNK